MWNSLKGSKTKKFLEYLTKIPDQKSLTKSKSFYEMSSRFLLQIKGYTEATLFVK
jgi:hypothetical protein